MYIYIYIYIYIGVVIRGFLTLAEYSSRNFLMTDYNGFLVINITFQEMQYFSKLVPMYFLHTQQ